MELFGGDELCEAAPPESGMKIQDLKMGLTRDLLLILIFAWIVSKLALSILFFSKSINIQ